MEGSELVNLILEVKNEFKSGDTVQLKSGGSIMTIEDIDGDSANCVWFIDNKVERNNFYLTTLKQYPID